MTKINNAKNKTTDGTKTPVCRRPRILRRPSNNVKCPTPAFSLDRAPMNPAHAPATSAIRNSWKQPCQRSFPPPGPPYEGIGFVSRSIMTGYVFLSNSKFEFIVRILCVVALSSAGTKKGVRTCARPLFFISRTDYSLTWASAASSNSPNSSAATAAASAARSISGSSSGESLREL